MPRLNRASIVSPSSPLPHVSSPLSPPALPLLHPYLPPSPPLPLSHLFSSFPLRRLFTFFRHVFMFWALNGVQKYRYVLKSYHEFDLMGWQVNLFIKCKTNEYRNEKRHLKVFLASSMSYDRG